MLEESASRYARLDGTGRRLYQEAKDALLQHWDFFPLAVPPPAMNSVFLAILDDCPQLFWFEGIWSVIERETRPMVCPEYNCDERLSLRRAAELDDVLRELVSRFEGLNQFRTALGLYEWMVGNVDYGISCSNGQTAYDALVRRTALCKGISKGYQLLLSQFEIPSTLMRGSIGGNGLHVWNLVRIGGRLLHIDISLAHRRFDHLFSRDERDNPYRCFLMDGDAVRSHGVMIEEGAGYVCV